MKVNRGLGLVAGVVWLAGSGCTSLREIPRGDYAARPQREHVRVVTSDGLVYQFDYASFGADSVVGFKRRDTENRVEEYASLGLPLEQVAHLSTRGIDWTRTGLVGGGVVLAVVAAVVRANQDDGPGGGSGGGPIRPGP